MKNVTRRSALGLFVAAGGATLLAACGSQSQASSGSASESASSNASGSASASASASKSVRSDYSGVAVLEGYTSKPSDYQPATRTEPSKNAPVPTKPAVANENSVCTSPSRSSAQPWNTTCVPVRPSPCVNAHSTSLS